MVNLCKDILSQDSGYHCILGDAAEVSHAEFWVFVKKNGINIDDNFVIVEYRRKYFQQKIWFVLGKIMHKNHQSIFNYGIRYFIDDINKPFKACILDYPTYMPKKIGITIYLYPTINKGK